MAPSFASRLIRGRDLGIEEDEDERKKIIKQDRFIDEKIKGVWQNWRKVEQDSRRPARSSTKKFMRRKEEFEKLLKTPFNISKIGAEEVIRNSGIKDWKEENEYLQNQLSEEQLGCPGSVDNKQRNRDNRLITEVLRAEANEQKSLEDKKDLMERKRMEKENFDEGEDIDNNNDKTYAAGKLRKKKVDIMGKISLTADRANVSYTARAMIAASTINAIGGNIDETNISKTTAWRKAQKARSQTAAQIKTEF